MARAKGWKCDPCGWRRLTGWLVWLCCVSAPWNDITKRERPQHTPLDVPINSKQKSRCGVVRDWRWHDQRQKKCKDTSKDVLWVSSVFCSVHWGLLIWILKLYFALLLSFLKLHFELKKRLSSSPCKLINLLKTMQSIKTVCCLVSMCVCVCLESVVSGDDGHLMEVYRSWQNRMLEVWSKWLELTDRMAGSGKLFHWSMECQH